MYSKKAGIPVACSRTNEGKETGGDYRLIGRSIRMNTVEIGTGREIEMAVRE